MLILRIRWEGKVVSQSDCFNERKSLTYLITPDDTTTVVRSAS